MTKLENIAVDLLFRIDFYALICADHCAEIDHHQFEKEEDRLKSIFGFKNYCQRNPGGHKYVRLTEVENHIEGYCKYLELLDQKGLLDCCQLEQALGVFEAGILVAFLSTDTGKCYNLPAHLKAVEEILKKGESDLCSINTFYGKLNKDTIELLYSPESNNIDISKDEEVHAMILPKTEFAMALEAVKVRADQFFDDLKAKLVSAQLDGLDVEFAEQVFGTGRRVK